MSPENTQTLNKQATIAVIGECMIELHGAPPNLTQGFAGDTLNTAVYAARILDAHLAQISYMTAVGCDPFSDRMLALWEAEGILRDRVLRIQDRNPGLYSISVDKTGERSFHYWRGESAAKLMFECEGAAGNLDALSDFDWIYLSGISLAILPESSQQKLFKALEHARSNGAKVAFDNNFRPKLWPSLDQANQVYNTMFDLTDLALLTLDDEVAMRGEESTQNVIERVAAHGVSEIVLKRGAQECIVYTQQHQWQVPAKNVEYVVDTTAAGDSFSAAYLAARVTGLTPNIAAEWGHKLAAEVIQHPGAIIPKNAMPQFA